MTPVPPPTHYEILGLPSSLQNDTGLTAQTLRAAYRRALLRCHPDKSNANGTTLKSSHSAYQAEFSVDQISTAYSTLSDARGRREYDKELKAQSLLNGTTNGNGGVGDKMFKTGVEVVDLDDLEYDEAQRIWYRGCRCGDERGFEVREEDLEEAGDEGEVVVGCRGCSLWLKVQFGVVEDEGDLGRIQDSDGLDGKGGHEGT